MNKQKITTIKTIDLIFSLIKRRDKGHVGELQWQSCQKKNGKTVKYIIDASMPVQPTSEEAAYCCEVGYEIYDDQNITIVLVRIISPILVIGEKVSVSFSYGRKTRDLNEKCEWRGRIDRGGISAEVLPRTEQIGLLGQKIPGNRPQWVVVVEKVLNRSHDGSRRTYGVALLEAGNVEHGFGEGRIPVVVDQISLNSKVQVRVLPTPQLTAKPVLQPALVSKVS